MTARDCCWFIAACFGVCAAGVWVRWVTTDETSIETIGATG